MFRIKNNLFCINCGKTNHKYNNCNEPITSYGLICYYKDKIVLIRRKYTFAYIDFIMGKYDINDIKYLTVLFSRMTKNEIKKILKTLDFDKLRNEIGLNNYTRYHKQEYENSKLKFTYIKNLHTIEDIIYIIDRIFNTEFIKILIENNEENNYIIKNKDFDINKETFNKIRKQIDTKIIYDDPEWEIPKGKRNDRDCNISTAIREFIEESNLTNIIVYKNIIPLEEEFTAINNNRYKHIYYLSKLKNVSLNDEHIITNEYNNCNTMNINDASNDSATNGNTNNGDNYTNNIESNIILPIDKDNEDQCREISLVGLISVNSIEDYLRPYQIEKKKVIYKSYQIFNNYEQYFY